MGTGASKAESLFCESEPRLWPISAPKPKPARSQARFWAHVAAFGALWGALEITVGSFVHIIRLPLGGVALAAVAAALLVAQRQLLPMRGLSLATGIVAALCKSVSPGGVILGPMVGITVEAAAVELALLLSPRALPSAFLAGALAVTWAMFQGVLTHYVYFGGTVIDLYVALLERGARLFGLTAGQGFQVVGTFVLLISIFGGAVALGGRAMGKRIRQRLSDQSRPQGW